MNHRLDTPRRSRKWVAAAATVGVLAAAGGAFAYWTATGSGTGSATTKAATTAVTVNQTSTITNLAPGSGTQALSGTFTHSNSGPVYIAGVSASVSSVTKLGLPAVGCDATDYTIAGTSTVPGEVEPGSGSGSWSGLTIEFNNKGSNQDACKGATVNLAYTTS